MRANRFVQCELTPSVRFCARVLCLVSLANRLVESDRRRGQGSGQKEGLPSDSGSAAMRTMCTGRTSQNSILSQTPATHAYPES